MEWISHHEAMSIQRGKPILKDTQLDKESFNIGTSFTEIEELWTLREHSRGTLTPLPTWEAGAPPSFHTTSKTWKGETRHRLSKGFHITIHFDTGFKNMNKGDVQSMCLNLLHKMNILLGTNYSIPIDIGLNQIIKNWVDFLSYIASTHSKMD